jgi:transposase-like protein
MRLKLILPIVEPEQYTQPKHCSDPKCKGNRFIPWQEVQKHVRDTEYEEVVAQRYKCLRCGKTFRVYPRGVLKGQLSQRLKGMGVLLYVLGLSYGATSLMLEALGVYESRSSVYRAVQATAEAVPGMKRTALLEGYRTKALGSDLTSVKCNGQWLPIGVSVDAINGLVLCIDGLEGEDAETLKKWIEPLADQVGAETLVTDDADAFKEVADRSGLDHQICKSHVVRNTEELIATLSALIESGNDSSLADLQIESSQALADLRCLGEMIHERRPEQQNELLTLYERYATAPAPKKNKTTSVAYRMRNLFLDRWNLWPRLTYYRTWKDKNGQPILDGTNNATERAIGWWVKERYRTMRGYKREQSALNVSRLIAYCGNHLKQGVNLAALVT